MNGYTGKILRINLTTKETSIIDTKKYEQWGGGHGIGSALFWDLCEDKTVDGLDPKNVVTIMTSPLVGTIAPAAAGRTEVQGIGVQAHPKGWFTRSNFGGQFAAMLKFAGWDGIVIEGKADKPVWIDIRNNNIEIKDANGLWGKDTWETQELIQGEVEKNFNQWHEVGTSRDTGRTTQKPAVLANGPAGENLVTYASLVHGSGNGAGQGGFGAIWGSKNLKAISVLGTGSVEVADPSVLLEARIALQKRRYDVDKPLRKSTHEDPTEIAPWGMPYALTNLSYRSPGFAGPGAFFLQSNEKSRPKGCVGCFVNCRRNSESGRTNESTCVDIAFAGANPEAQHAATESMQRLGINNFVLSVGFPWLKNLYKMGVLGPGKEIHTNLPFDRQDSPDFYNALMKAIANREDIGADLAEGLYQAAEKWGRLEDIETGLLRITFWGYPEHYDPRIEVEWSYASILGDRDFNDHALNWYIHWIPFIGMLLGEEPLMSAEQVVNLAAEALVPYKDPMLLDYSEENIYSENKVKMISWIKGYNLFWKNSLGYCDWAWPDLINLNQEDYKGFTPDAEPLFYNAVTGQNITFEDGMKIGSKIWNLDRAIYILQGRHRDMEVLSGYVYKVPNESPYKATMFIDGEWSYDDGIGRVLDEEKYEEWKTKYYSFEGWDPKTGWPKRSTLEELGLGYVADELEKQGKLGN
ncbi:aldehyde ferredoxin oxidoreductase N-terminal domain-containing protein [Bacillus sp. B15-48]|uniref:aldehyde ferredoxin oxidoreductase N-terminal domain-containing protein n=1 Tax=Bacillus sp. B15-48 TaxID=1548601 RepID=UPI0019400F74|nr:aldehyde ferredoxin oxidoreductase N-terminal domain-containing protein [Bacillus sp. B15-48]MBM4764516.1 aldehyde:ferredoxin oxidoreductase [Bacillus sp. B15-48]